MAMEEEEVEVEENPLYGNDGGGALAQAAGGVFKGGSSPSCRGVPFV